MDQQSNPAPPPPPSNDPSYYTRQATYTAWPHLNPTVSEMAAAGFHQVNGLNTYPHEYADMVACAQCRVLFSGWGHHEDPLLVHARRSPGCDLVRTATMMRGGLWKPAWSRVGMPSTTTTVKTTAATTATTATASALTETAPPQFQTATATATATAKAREMSVSTRPTMTPPAAAIRPVPIEHSYEHVLKAAALSRTGSNSATRPTITPPLPAAMLPVAIEYSYEHLMKAAVLSGKLSKSAFLRAGLSPTLLEDIPLEVEDWVDLGLGSEGGEQDDWIEV